MSLVPTRSAFSVRLHRFGFNFYSLLAPDLMHDFELGTWRDTLKHILRILHAAGNDCIQEFNERFRQVHPFGRNTIRRFNTNVSALKGIAARDYEDILQCIIPVVEGLLPEPYDTILREFLFTSATWHALAKLRLHTERTLKFFEDTTRLLGAEVRRFEKTICQHYRTTELPSEAAARGRREAALAEKSKPSKVAGQRVAKKRKLFNLRTYKWHSLPDYPASIRMFGTTDNTSTQPGEGEHRRAKKFWNRVHKGKYVEQIAKQQRRERVMRRIHERLKKRDENLLEHSKDKCSARKKISAIVDAPASATNEPSSRRFTDAYPTPISSPDIHYHISQDPSCSYEISEWLSEHRDDPAFKDFLPNLEDHILDRLSCHQYAGDDHHFTDEDRDSLRFRNNIIYEHSMLRINYTTYDMRRCQDTISPRTRRDHIMLYAHDDKDGKSLYWYARVLGVFHIDVKKAGGSQYKRMDVLWAIFITPKQHLLDLSTQTNGRTADLLPRSCIRDEEEDDEDWNLYYINIFVDRDMFMRYLGGGIGHAESDRLRSSGVPDTASLIPNDDGDDGGNADVSAGMDEDPDVQIPAIEDVLRHSSDEDEDRGPDEGEDDQEDIRSDDGRGVLGEFEGEGGSDFEGESVDGVDGENEEGSDDEDDDTATL
ncbi:hypothetical protein K474DRAFT_1776565 [Panus rudis PR-1116 ss-1]|nr:hypothetical protein K474DRAFT_1776565 [Panus rudis PR-1116 ss-1]